MNILFEPNFNDVSVEPNGKYFDCYSDGFLIGRIEVFKNHYLKNKQEFYIEVLKNLKKQGYTVAIYNSFKEKCKNLDLKILLFML